MSFNNSIYKNFIYKKYFFEDTKTIYKKTDKTLIKNLYKNHLINLDKHIFRYIDIFYKNKNFNIYKPSSFYKNKNFNIYKPSSFYKNKNFNVYKPVSFEKDKFEKFSVFNSKAYLYNKNLADFYNIKTKYGLLKNFKNIYKYIKQNKNLEINKSQKTKTKHSIVYDINHNDIFNKQLEITKSLDYDFIFDKIKDMIYEELIFMYDIN